MKEYSLTKVLAFTVTGLLIFILYLYFFIGVNDIIEVFKSVNLYNYLFFYSIMIVAMVLSMLFYSMSWNNLMMALSINAGLKKAFICCWLGNFVDLIIPLETVSGEIIRAYLIHKDSWEVGRVIASVIVHRIITVFVTLSSLLLSSLIFILKYNAGTEIICLLMTIITGSFILIASLLYISLRREVAEKIINTLINIASPILKKWRFDSSETKRRVSESLLQFHSGFKLFSKRWSVIVKSLFYSFIAWFFHLSVYLLTFFALGFSEISTKFAESIIVYAISVATQSIPMALPTGLVEIVMTNLYILFSIPAAISGTATILIRTVTFWFQIIVGYILAQWIGIKKIGGGRLKETSTC